MNRGYAILRDVVGLVERVKPVRWPKKSIERLYDVNAI